MIKKIVPKANKQAYQPITQNLHNHKKTKFLHQSNIYTQNIITISIIYLSTHMTKLVELGLTAVQGLLALTVASQSISGIVYKEKMNTIIRHHKDQVKNIQNIKTYINQVNTLDQTANAIKMSMSLVGEQWTQIILSLKQQSDFCNLIKKRLDDEKLPEQQVPIKDLILAPLTVLAAIGVVGLFAKGTNYVRLTRKFLKFAHRRMVSGQSALLVNRVAPIPLPDRRPGSGPVSDSGSINIDEEHPPPPTPPSTPNHDNTPSQTPVVQFEDPFTIALPEKTVTNQTLQSVHSQQTLVSPHSTNVMLNQVQDVNNFTRQINETNELESFSQLKTKGVEIGVRGFAIIVAGAGVVFEGLAVDGYHKSLNKLKSYYDNLGQFTFASVQKNMITTTIFFSTNLYQLILASNYALNDLVNMLLMKGMNTPGYFNKCYNLAMQVRPASLDINQDKIRAYRNFSKKIQDISNNGENFTKQIASIHNQMKQFMEKYKPKILIQNICTKLSSVLELYSLGSEIINQQTKTMRKFIQDTAKLFGQRKGRIKQLKKSEELMEEDKSNLKKIASFHKPIIQLDQVEKYPQYKEILYHVVGVFCDKFYYDDTSGQTIFKMKISDLKNKQMAYQDLYQQNEETNQDYDESDKKIYKFSSKDEYQEKDSRQQYIKQIRILKNQPDLQVQPIFRYIKYRNTTAQKDPSLKPINQKDPASYNPQEKLFVPYEGMKFLMPNKNNQVGYIEQNLYKRTYSLLKKKIPGPPIPPLDP